MAVETPYILPFEQCDASAHRRVGGKNASLGSMIQAGAPVPPGFAVTTDAYQEMLAANGLDRQIQEYLAQISPADVEGVESLSQAIRALIEKTSLPPSIEQAIRQAYAALCQKCGLDEVPVAVRSSATAEDLPGASFAGQQDTFLWIVGPEAVIAHISKCWSSLYTARAISYRIEKGFPHEKVYMSVGVQKMVNARAAGVMFTLNPINGDRSKVVIDASWGLGEAVVGGEVTPDNYLVDKIAMEIIKRTLSPKLIEYRADPQNRRVERLEVPAERQAIQCLSDEEILALTKYAKIAEKHYGRPQDLEWAIDADLAPPHNIVLLQSRPETVWSERERPKITSGGTSAMDHIVANLMAGVKVKKD
ncbi:MAG: phenylphosphate synthase subunit beta [Anaerolineae bacterium]|nr:phenylphosphate synthase subunit beta [Anaerolineae bacterium]